VNLEMVIYLTVVFLIVAAIYLAVKKEISGK
jgi:hypothetical protein